MGGALVPWGSAPYLRPMRPAVSLLALALLLRCHGAATAAGAQPGAQRVWSPVLIGHYGDWSAATHQEAGQTICYAYSFAKASQPVLVGRGRVVLTVTRRPGARPAARDAVAITLGYQVLPHAGASVRAGGKKLGFYLEGRSAFAPHGADAVAAFAAGREAVGQFPGPRGVTLSDHFSLTGFAAAYAAMAQKCGS